MARPEAAVRAAYQGDGGDNLVRDTLQDRLALPALAVGVLAVGSAAIFIRLADAPAIAVSFWRCAFGVVMLAPFVFLRRESFPRGKALVGGIVSGVVLAAHFGFWISSLDYTSVAASIVLVSASPVFVAVMAYVALGERTSGLSIVGISVSLVGTVITATDDSVGSASLFGNLLAVAGAITFAVYVLIGRSSRTGGVGALAYSVVAYTSASVTLGIVAVLFGVPLSGYSGETWFWLLMIAVGPQILGHTVFNWTLGFVEASVVSGVTLAEPIVSTVLAWIVLSEVPGIQTVVGGVVVLFGLYVLIAGRRKDERG